jgi:hypothetical protein
VLKPLPASRHRDGSRLVLEEAAARAVGDGLVRQQDVEKVEKGRIVASF